MVRPEEGTQREAVAGEEEGAKRPRSVYASEQDALEGAGNELGRIRRGTAEFRFTLAEGRTDLSSETPRTVVGFKQEVDGTNWILTECRHRIEAGRVVTETTAETVLF
jgi:phage protein D